MDEISQQAALLRPMTNDPMSNWTLPGSFGRRKAGENKERENDKKFQDGNIIRWIIGFMLVSSGRSTSLDRSPRPTYRHWAGWGCNCNPSGCWAGDRGLIAGTMVGDNDREPHGGSSFFGRYLPLPVMPFLRAIKDQIGSSADPAGEGIRFTCL